MGFTIKGGSVRSELIEKSSSARRDLQELVNIAARASFSRNDLLPQQKIIEAPIDELRPSPRRVRKRSNAQIERIIQSIRIHGFRGAILIRDGVIVDGHMRVEAAKAIGLTHVPAIEVTNCSDALIDFLSISMNRIAETGEWNLDETTAVLKEQALAGMPLDASGFSGRELDQMFREVGATPEPLAQGREVEIITQTGDLYILDRHKLLCGDALDPHSYERLFEGEIATAAFVDGPYNVKIKNNVSGLGKVKHDEFRMASGEMSPQQFNQFMQRWMKNTLAYVVSGGVIFSCIDWRHDADMEMAARAVGLQLINKCTWDKGSGGMGGFYRSRTEIVQVLCTQPCPLINNIELGRHGRDRSNLWAYPGANRRGSSASKRLKDHATPKPVDLVADAILDVTERGDIVLDPFVGSGTTILAAEETGRRAFGIEIEPKFVDAAVRSWEAMTALSKEMHRSVRRAG